jgi:DNA-binding CsgD family transcriptional regulator
LLGSGAILREVGISLVESGGLPDGNRPTAERASNDAVAERVRRLTAGQLDCLRLVHQHLSSKEIAAELGISPHTVDQRVRQSLQILGVSRRAQAARIVAQYSEPYQRLIHQAPYIPAEAESGHPEAAVSHQIRHADRAGEAGGPGFLTEQRPASFWPSLQLPFATRSNPRNEMSVGQRLFWIATIAIGAAFSAGMYLAGLESLARLLKS